MLSSRQPQAKPKNGSYAEVPDENVSSLPRNRETSSPTSQQLLSCSPITPSLTKKTDQFFAMQQVLRQVAVPNTNLSSHDLLSDDKSQKSHTRRTGIENDPKEEERTTSNEQKVSHVDYGLRDECPEDDNSASSFTLGEKPIPEVRSLPEDFFKSSETEENVLKHIPDIVIPSPVQSAPNPTDTCNPLIRALQKISSSKVPDANSIRDFVTSADFPSSIQEAYSHSLIPSVYDMMLRHKTDEEVQILGAQLLQKTAIHVPQGATEIGKGNGIQLAIHSMLLNSDCLAIQSAVAAALAALCSTSENRIIAGKFFAVEAIVNATRKFLDEKYLQGACMKLLAALSSEPENTDVIVNTESYRLPFRVIKRHKRTKILVRIACGCVHQLLKNFDEPDMDQVAQINPMKILLSAVLEYPDDERIQVAATECATVFCNVNSECLITSVNVRAADLCVRNLKRFRGSEHGRLHLACMKMLCLFAEAGCIRTVVTAGALEGCLTCMIEMRKVFAMQVCCLRLLERAVTTGEEAYLQRIITAGGLEVITSSLKMYISREEFVDRGVRVMRILRG